MLSDIRMCIRTDDCESMKSETIYLSKIGGFKMDKERRSALSQQCVLVRLTFKHPSGIKKDNDLSRQLAELNNVADAKLVPASKHIYGHDINKYFRSISNSFRNHWFNPKTLPWSDASDIDEDGHKIKGWRLCPNTILDTLEDKFNESKIEWEKEVDGFCKNYDSMKEGARRNLGDAFDADNYPSVEEIRKKFKFHMETALIPEFTSDIRITASERMQKRIEADALNRANNNIKEAMVVTVGALVESAEHLSTKLSEYNPKSKKDSFFNQSSIDNLRNAVEMLPAINSDVLGNMPEIHKAHQKLVRVFTLFDDATSLRDSSESGDKKRKEVSQNLDDAIGGLKGGFLDKAFGGKKDVD